MVKKMRFKSEKQRKKVMAMLRKKGIRDRPIEYAKTDRYHRIRLRHPGTFQQGSLRTIDPGRPGGMKLIIGRPKGISTTRTQAVLIPVTGGKKWWTTHPQLAERPKHDRSAFRVGSRGFDNGGKKPHLVKEEVIIRTYEE